MCFPFELKTYFSATIGVSEQRKSERKKKESCCIYQHIAVSKFYFKLVFKHFCVR